MFIASLLSGAVIYAPHVARRPFGTIRRARRVRVRWIDLHNLLGIVTVLWATVVGLTGTINTLVGPVTTLWKADQLAAMTIADAGLPVPTRRSSLDSAVARAMSAAPGMRPQFVAFPGAAYSSSHHYAIFLQGKSALTQKLLTPAFVDTRTGTLQALRPMPWYMQALLLAQPLHFGDYGGLAMKILWAILDAMTIMVLGSGLYLWRSRTKKVVIPTGADCAT